ncbi:MAG TPA: hypothetical protein VKT52_10060, partial [Ktedonobacterales bacterium]|nr:hypothetical protein [Ktedonobacterales bacterium]
IRYFVLLECDFPNLEWSHTAISQRMPTQRCTKVRMNLICANSNSSSAICQLECQCSPGTGYVQEIEKANVYTHAIAIRTEQKPDHPGDMRRAGAEI